MLSIRSIENGRVAVVDSWGWNHKHLIVTLSLLAALVYQVWAPEFEGEPLVYVNDDICEQLECRVKKLTVEIFLRDQDLHLENARLEAIMVVNRELLEMTKVSPYLDYEEVSEKAGVE